MSTDPPETDRSMQTSGHAAPADALRYTDVTVVCAHPDDESFGLGALITVFSDVGARLRLLCFTAGETSTLGAGPDLDVRRAAELRCAAGVLGIQQVILGHHPDGALATIPIEELAAEIVAAGPDAQALLTFDHGGITGHLDHQHATTAAVEAARHLGIPAWGWALPERVAATLRAEFGGPFVGREDHEVDLIVPVDRTRQQQVLIAPTSTVARGASFRPEIEIEGTTTRVLVEQTGAVDVSRLGDQHGHLTPEEQWGVDLALETVLDLQ
jgi:N-acetylglucosamine malate deacetylase 2